MVPKVSAPLTKLIRTTEGVLVIVFNAVLVAASTAGSLPWATTAKWGAVIATATMISRQGLKAIAAIGAKTGIQPQTWVSTSGLAPAQGAGVAFEAVQQVPARLESAVKPDLPDGSPIVGRLVDAAHAPSSVPAQAMPLIEQFEGFSAVQYRDSVGVATIGFGTTAADISPLPKTCTRAQAQQWLVEHLAAKYMPAIDALHLPLNDNQRAALLSLAYNCGPGIVDPPHTIAIDLAAHRWAAAGNDFMLYTHAGGQVLQGLVNRRRAEQKLFLTPVPHPKPKPAPHKAAEEEVGHEQL